MHSSYFSFWMVINTAHPPGPVPIEEREGDTADGRQRDREQEAHRVRRAPDTDAGQRAGAQAGELGQLHALAQVSRCSTYILSTFCKFN